MPVAASFVRSFVVHFAPVHLVPVYVVPVYVVPVYVVPVYVALVYVVLGGMRGGPPIPCPDAARAGRFSSLTLPEPDAART